MTPQRIGRTQKTHQIGYYFIMVLQWGRSSVKPTNIKTATVPKVKQNVRLLFTLIRERNIQCGMSHNEYNKHIHGKHLISTAMTGNREIYKYETN